MFEKVRISTLTMLRFHSLHPIWKENIHIIYDNGFQQRTAEITNKSNMTLINTHNLQAPLNRVLLEELIVAR
jgi:hypothetical protein